MEPNFGPEKPIVGWKKKLYDRKTKDAIKKNLSNEEVKCINSLIRYRIRHRRGLEATPEMSEEDGTIEIVKFYVPPDFDIENSSIQVQFLSQRANYQRAYTSPTIWRNGPARELVKFHICSQVEDARQGSDEFNYLLRDEIGGMNLMGHDHELLTTFS